MSTTIETPTLRELIAQVKVFTEKVQHRHAGMLPSEIQKEFSAIQAGMRLVYGDRAPSGWKELVQTAEIFIATATRPQPSPGAVAHLSQMISEQASKVMLSDVSRIAEEGLLSSGQAVRRATFVRMSPADQARHVRAGKAVFD